MIRQTQLVRAAPQPALFASKPQLGQFSGGADDGAPGIRMGSEAHSHAPAVQPGRQARDDRDAKISRQVQRPEISVLVGQMLTDFLQPGVIDAVEVDARQRRAVVPPQRHVITLHELEQAVEDRLLERVAGRVPVRLTDAAIGSGYMRAVVAESGRHQALMRMCQRPDRAPADRGGWIEPLRHIAAKRTGARVPFLAFVELLIAETHVVVGGNRPIAELLERGLASGLDSLESARPALEGLAQRTGSGRLVACALAARGHSGQKLPPSLIAVDADRTVGSAVDVKSGRAGYPHERVHGSADRADVARK